MLRWRGLLLSKHVSARPVAISLSVSCRMASKAGQAEERGLLRTRELDCGDNGRLVY